MQWLSQFSLVMRSSITSLKEKIEDPERMLHQLIIDMEEELERVRRSVAEAVADEIQMRKRAERERGDAERWSARASAALRRGDETGARTALEQKLSATQRADRYAADHAGQQSEVVKLQEAVRDLKDKIRQARQKKTLLTARIARASSARKISDVLQRSSSQSAFAQFSRMEQRLDREEALCEAWDRMDGRDPDAAELDRRFEEQERRERLAQELDLLKSSLNPEQSP